MILVYVTHPDKDHATSMVRILVEEKLIACANIYPINSIYSWEGKIVEETEYVSLLKSFESLKDKLKTRIADLHQYDIPCIIDWNADANTLYGNWLKGCVDIADIDDE